MSIKLKTFLLALDRRLRPAVLNVLKEKQKKNCLEQRSEKSADNYVWKKFSDNILNKFAHSNN